MQQAMKYRALVLINYYLPNKYEPTDSGSFNLVWYPFQGSPKFPTEKSKGTLSLSVQDLVVHVRDISHPECEAQLEDVMTVLEKQLNIKAPLFDSMIEAQNKTDLWYASLTVDTVIVHLSQLTGTLCISWQFCCTCI